MELSNILLSENTPLKYFYCCIDDKEYILYGDQNGYIYNVADTYNVGTIVLNILEKREDITLIIEKYIDIISSDNREKNEIFIQKNINDTLQLMQDELDKLNLSILHYMQFSEYISNSFIKSYLQLNITEKRYTNSKETLKAIEKILDLKEFPNNKHVLDILSKDITKNQKHIEELKNISYKGFTISILKDILQSFASFLFNFYIFFSNNDELTIDLDIKKFHFSDNFEKIKFLQNYYNVISFNNFSENTYYPMLVILDDDKIYFDDIPDNFRNKPILNYKMINVFAFNNLIELLNLSFINIIEKRINIKECKNCGNYFITENRTDEVYCNRKSPQNPNKTCKEYGAKKTYRDEIKSIPLKYEHNKTSQFYRMRINRSKTEKEKSIYKKAFDKYKKEYQNKKSKYKLGKLNENDFIEWIKYQKNNI